MKKVAAAFTFTLLAVAAFTQQDNTIKTKPTPQPTLSYRLDTLQRDSFFLVETFTAAPSKEVPRPNSQIRNEFFTDTAQVRLYVAALRRDAKAYYDEAVLRATKAQGIEALINNSEWFGAQKKPEQPKVVTKPDKPTDPTKPPETKPTKKKKKH